MSCKDTKVQKTVSTQKRIAIALYFIRSTTEYSTVANVFGISTSFICKCIKDVAKAIVGKLRCNFLSIPKGSELLGIIKLYKEKSMGSVLRRGDGWNPHTHKSPN